MTQVEKGKPLNRFELRLKNDVAERWLPRDSTIDLEAEIWIDGHHLDEPHSIDLPELIFSCHKERWFGIFSCGCGKADCAGIVDGIHVTHQKSEDLIRWALRLPQSAENLLDHALSEWEKAAIQLDFAFDRAQMTNAINTFLDGVRRLVGAHPERFSYPIHGHAVQDILTLDPDHPHCWVHCS